MKRNGTLDGRQYHRGVVVKPLKRPFMPGIAVVLGAGAAALGLSWGSCSESLPSPRPLPPDVRVASFTGGRFKELDGQSSRGSASLAVSRARGYADRGALLARNSGGSGFARGWFDVRWRAGSDVRYGAAFFIPSARAIGYADLVRWDNYAHYGQGGDIGGIEINDGRAYLMRADYGGDNFAKLGDDFSLPEDRWFTLDVHQRFSAEAGVAFSEVRIDGERVATSTDANSRGRPIDNLRFGFVFVDGPPSRVRVDRVYSGAGP
jgi:hypothetical protein